MTFNCNQIQFLNLLHFVILLTRLYSTYLVAYFSHVFTDLNVYIESNVYNAPESNQNLLISLAADGISEFPFIVTLQIDSGSASEVLHTCVLACVIKFLCHSDTCCIKVCTCTFACVRISIIQS